MSFMSTRAAVSLEKVWEIFIVEKRVGVSNYIKRSCNRIEERDEPIQNQRSHVYALASLWQGALAEGKQTDPCEPT